MTILTYADRAYTKACYKNRFGMYQDSINTFGLSEETWFFIWRIAFKASILRMWIK